MQNIQNFHYKLHECSTNAIQVYNMQVIYTNATQIEYEIYNTFEVYKH